MVLFKGPLRLRRKWNAMARDKLEQPQRQPWIFFELRRRAKIDALMRNRELGIGQARTPVAELMEQRAFAFLGGIQRSACLAIDAAGVLKVFAHDFRGRV